MSSGSCPAGCKRSRRRREPPAPRALASLSPDDRESVLRRVEQSHAELFEALVRHTYDGYYSHPTVIARLGLDAGPLHPRGHRVEAVDLPDLARVTARGPIYRRLSRLVVDRWPGQGRDDRRADDDERGQEEHRPVAAREVEHEPAGVGAEGARAVVEEVRRAEDRAVVRGPEELADQGRGQRRRREERRPEQPREEVELPGLAHQREVEERGGPEPVGEHEGGAGADSGRHGAGDQDAHDVGRRPEADRVRGDGGCHAEVGRVGREVRGHEEVGEAAAHEPDRQGPERGRPHGGPAVEGRSGGLGAAGTRRRAGFPGAVPSAGTGASRRTKANTAREAASTAASRTYVWRQPTTAAARAATCVNARCPTENPQAATAETKPRSSGNQRLTWTETGRMPQPVYPTAATTP